MLSRVANSVYWMFRYLERAENYARFMDVNFNLSLELPPTFSEQWQPLITTTGDWALYKSLHGKIEKKKAIYFLGFDSSNPNSVYNSIINARENARAIRPEITKEVWEQINYLYHHIQEGKTKKRWQLKNPTKFFTEIKKGCQMTYGIIDATITRSEAWHFGKIGQLIERADKTSRVLDVKYHILLPSPQAVGTPLDLIQWAALLKSVSAYDMYRKEYGKLNPGNISEFLIFDRHFPRSVLHCLTEIEESVRLITGNSNGFSNAAEKELGKLRAQLEYADIADIFKTGLHEYLDNFQKKLNKVAQAIFDTFFSIENIKKNS